LTLGRAGGAAFLGAAACVGVLHAVQSDLSPLSSRLSAYATGRAGWLMTAAFLLLAAGLAAFALQVWRTDVPVGVLCLVGAVGLALSALFPTGVSAGAEQWHSPASAIATSATTLAVMLRTIHLGRRGSALDAALAGSAAVLLVVSPALHETRWTGAGQRLLWAVLVVWLVRACRRESLDASGMGRNRRALRTTAHTAED
jgi:Protein of unknown function (DUF998)